MSYFERIKLMARNRERRRERRAGNVSPVAAVFMPGEQATVERLRAGAFGRWQELHRGAAVAARTDRPTRLDSWLVVPDTRPGRPDGFYAAHYVNPDDRRAPKDLSEPFAKSIRKCEPAGPFATSTGFSTRL
jgi:hypothetical protein